MKKRRTDAIDLILYSASNNFKCFYQLHVTSIIHAQQCNYEIIIRTHRIAINPLLPNVPQMERLAKILI